MTEQLIRRMSEIVIKEGAQGKARLASAVDRSTRMIDRYIEGTSVPSSTGTYRLALECGYTEEDALALAGETTSDGQGDPPEAA